MPILPPVCQVNNRFPGAKTILVVEDFVPLCDLVARHLSSSGYHVLVAHNAVEARVLAAANEHIDLLLTDLNMPGLRGDELAAWFSVEYPTTRIVIMSYQAVSAGANSGFLQKPFTLGELGEAVRSALIPEVFNSMQTFRQRIAA